MESMENMWLAGMRGIWSRRRKRRSAWAVFLSSRSSASTCMNGIPVTMTHTHTHTCWFLWFTGTLHRRNGFYTVQTVCAIALHLNLALTGDGAFLLSPPKTYSVWFISILNYGDTENVLINHLLLVIHMSYPCHYTNLCPHKPHKHAHTHTHTHTSELFLTIHMNRLNWFI